MNTSVDFCHIRLARWLLAYKLRAAGTTAEQRANFLQLNKPCETGLRQHRARTSTGKNMASFARRICPCLVFTMAALTFSGCHHKGRPAAWNGIWKLNAAKSRVHGAYFTIMIAPNGDVRITNEAYSFSFRCDGKEFSNGTNHTTLCTPVSANEWRLTGKSNGGSPHISIWDLSSDGRTLAICGSEIQPDGSEKPSEIIYERRSQGTGFAGRWQETMPLKTRPKLLVTALRGDILHLAYPEIGQYSDAPVGGTSVPLHGPRVHTGSEISITASGPQGFHTQIIFQGHVVREGTLSLSTDGKTLRQESWTPLKPSEMEVLIYDRE